MNIKVKLHLRNRLYKAFFYLFRLFPLQNKIVATTMRGRKFSDNPRFIVEQIHNLKPEWDYVWLSNKDYEFSLPNWLRSVYYYTKEITKIYELATAKVWINSHMFETYVRKRKGQLFVETWHGSIVLKKVYYDIPCYDTSSRGCIELDNTMRMADVILSNSKFNDDLYKSAFHYKGPTFNVGFPRNDGFINCVGVDKEGILNTFKQKNKKIFLYAPTFRDEYEASRYIDYENAYNVDFKRVYDALISRGEGEWIILVKFHPIMINDIKDEYFNLPYVLNASSYVNMQELLMASDIVLTDYSSSVIDAAIKGSACLTYAPDYADYKKQRGLYFELDTLPFPVAYSNDELIENIKKLDYKKQKNEWIKFVEKNSIVETGRASVLTANKIIEFVEGKKVDWKAVPID